MSAQVDLTFLKSFTAGDPAKMSKYINMFLKGAEPSLVQMKSQSGESDWTSLKTTSHSLKSQLKYMGVGKGVELAYAIESSCGENRDLDKIPQTLAELEVVVQEACQELRDELSKL